MKIVPSLLAGTFDNFLMKVRQAESFTDYVQIDLMDEIFVPTKSFPPREINWVKTSLSFELHLMVENPGEVIAEITHPGLRRVIFHVEAKGDHAAIIGEIRRRGIGAGLAIRPETDINDFIEMAREADTLLFLTVDPGDYGNPFRPEVLDKIERTRKVFPQKIIAVDGGVSIDNLRIFFDLGIDYVCVGSRIFFGGDPAENYRRFVEKVQKFGNR